MENKVKEAVDILCKALKEDEEYYYAWQANITMSFMDSIDWNKNLDSMYNWVDRDEVHKTANEAAKHFLSLLIKD